MAYGSPNARSARTPVMTTQGYGTGVGRRHHRWWYAWVPLFAAFIWLGTILSLLITWLASGRPHYVSMSSGQTIAYISDVAADFLKPLFIAATSITSVGFVLSLITERWARHAGRLLPNMRRREKVMSSLAIFGAFLGGLGLILLSIFDTKRHPKLHRVFLLIFVLGAALSAIFTVIEFRWLDKTYGHHYRRLRFAYAIKLIFVIILIILAIAFGALLNSSHQNTGAIIEWIIAFLFTFYLLTFFYDLMNSNPYPGQYPQGLVEGSAAYGQGNSPYRPSFEPTGPAMNERPGM